MAAREGNLLASGTGLLGGKGAGVMPVDTLFLLVVGLAAIPLVISLLDAR